MPMRPRWMVPSSGASGSRAVKSSRSQRQASGPRTASVAMAPRPGGVRQAIYVRGGFIGSVRQGAGGDANAVEGYFRPKYGLRVKGRRQQACIAAAEKDNRLDTAALEGFARR